MRTPRETNLAYLNQVTRAFSAAMELDAMGIPLLSIRTHRHGPRIRVGRCPVCANLPSGITIIRTTAGKRYAVRSAVMHGVQVEWREPL